MWHARLRYNDADYYGGWVPTGMTDIVAAKDYIKTWYARARVVEWLKL